MAEGRAQRPQAEAGQLGSARAYLAPVSDQWFTASERPATAIGIAWPNSFHMQSRTLLVGAGLRGCDHRDGSSQSEGEHALRRQNDLRPALRGFDSGSARATDGSADGRSPSASRQPADDGANARPGADGYCRGFAARRPNANLIGGPQVVI